MIMCLHWLMHYRAALGGALVSFLCRKCCAGQCPAALRAAASSFMQRSLVMRGAEINWLVRGSSANVFYWAKLLVTKSLIRHPWKDSSTLLIHKYLRFFSSDNLENQINMIYYLIVNAVK